MNDIHLKMNGIAHDINGLMARAGLAAEELRGHRDCDVKKQADRIAEAIDRVAEICRDQLTESLIARNGRLHRSGCIENLVRQIADLASVESLSGRKEIEFQCLVEDDVQINCNTPSLFRILFNLALNAANAVSKHGGSWVEIAVSQAYGRVYFDVSDDGPGLPDHVLAYLYPRVDTKHAPKGPIGSGLITAVALAREMNGRLRLIRTKSSGTSFCLELPQAPSRPLDCRQEVTASLVAPVLTRLRRETDSHSAVDL
ncbi:MAG: HAMP domain-containing sensor histidine kinase [Pseudomonadota bacterium]